MFTIIYVGGVVVTVLVVAAAVVGYLVGQGGESRPDRTARTLLSRLHSSDWL